MPWTVGPFSTGAEDYDTWDAATLRVVIASSLIVRPGSQVQLVFGRSMNNEFPQYVIGECFIGNKALSGDNYDFASAPTRVTFGGFDGVVVGASADVYSDLITFDLTGTNNIIVSFSLIGTDNENPYYYDFETNVIQTAYKNGVSEAGTVDVTGYSNWNYDSECLMGIRVPFSGTHYMEGGIVVGGAAVASSFGGYPSDWANIDYSRYPNMDPYSLAYLPKMWFKKPNWATPLKTEHMQQRQLLGFSYGTQHLRVPNPAPARIEASYMNFDKAAEVEMLNFFVYHEGRKKGFWVPSWMDQFKLTEDIAASASTIRVRNEGFYLRYQGYERLMLITRWGSYWTRHIASATKIDDDEEEFTLTTPFPTPIDMDDVESICLFLKVRFDNDSILVKYHTESVSEYTLTFRELIREYPNPVD